MKTYRQIVKDAGALLKKHEIGKNERVCQLWANMEWQEMPKGEESRDAVATITGKPLIRLYPTLLQSPTAHMAVLREFGEVIMAKGGERAKLVWDKKMDLPTPEQIDTARQKIMDKANRAACGTYEQVKNTYAETGTAVDRLVFINISNALLANNIPFRDSEGVDIKKWGPTVEYAHFKKYHYLIPLTSAYCPKHVHEKFGHAFAELITKDLNCCRDSSVAAAMRRIIKNVASRLDPFPPIG